MKVTKWPLRRIIGDQVLTYVESYTCLCTIEAILSWWTLLSLHDDITVLEPLTPAHLSIQRSSFLVPEPNHTAKKV